MLSRFFFSARHGLLSFDVVGENRLMTAWSGTYIFSACGHATVEWETIPCSVHFYAIIAFLLATSIVCLLFSRLR